MQWIFKLEVWSCIPTPNNLMLQGKKWNTADMKNLLIFIGCRLLRLTSTSLLVQVTWVLKTDFRAIKSRSRFKYWSEVSLFFPILFYISHFTLHCLFQSYLGPWNCFKENALSGRVNANKFCILNRETRNLRQETQLNIVNSAQPNS